MSATNADVKKKSDEAVNLGLGELKFYNANNEEVLAGVKSTAECYVLHVKRALEYADDRECAMSFLSGMSGDKATNDILQGGGGTMFLLMLGGIELRKYLAGFKVPGIARFEFSNAKATADRPFSFLR